VVAFRTNGVGGVQDNGDFSHHVVAPLPQQGSRPLLVLDLKTEARRRVRRADKMRAAEGPLAQIEAAPKAGRSPIDS